jgi:XRE family transcriptional regulator, aerobic/anaerobic benzoate catabolism transcriptional regulator
MNMNYIAWGPRHPHALFCATANPPMTPTPPSASADYLHLLGARVRRVRAQRGMSRRILAAASGISERYLAQLECGTGNASILVLQAVAAAMHIALDDLVEPRSEQPPAYLLLRERLRGASPEQYGQWASLLRGGEHHTSQHRNHIALIGLRGAGKSTLGAALAKRLGLPFVELGQEIERAAGMATKDIFDQGGQLAYRGLERQALSATLVRHSRAVIATGGSLVSQPDTFELLLERCFTVWLKATPRQHMARVIAQGDHRPMADHRHAMADLKRILSERAALYGRADATLDTSDSDVQTTLRNLLAREPVRALQKPVEALA